MITRTEMLNYSIAMDNYAATQTSDVKGFGNKYIGADGSSIVTNYANGTEIYTSSGSDTITSIGGGVVIDSQDGDDTLIAVGAGLDIEAGDGNDKVYSQGVENIVHQGTGNDEFFVSGYGGELVHNENDTSEDVVKNPEFDFQYVKDQGLLLAPWYDINNYLTQEMLGDTQETVEGENTDDSYYS